MREIPILVLPSLCTAVGVDQAIVLQKLAWLLAPEYNNGAVLADGHRYIYNTYEEWRRDHFDWWSERTIQRIFTQLEKGGWIIAVQPEGTVSRRKYYRVSEGQRQHLTYSRIREAAQQRKSSVEGAKSGCSGSTDSGTIEDAKSGTSSYKYVLANKTTSIHTGESPIPDECVQALASLECKDLAEVTDWPKHRVAASKIRSVCPGLTPAMIAARAANYQLNFSVPITSTGLAKHWGLCASPPAPKEKAALPVEKPKRPNRAGNYTKEDFAEFAIWKDYLKACKERGFEPEEMR